MAAPELQQVRIREVQILQGHAVISSWLLLPQNPVNQKRKPCSPNETWWHKQYHQAEATRVQEEERIKLQEFEEKKQIIKQEVIKYCGLCGKEKCYVYDKDGQHSCKQCNYIYFDDEVPMRDKWCDACKEFWKISLLIHGAAPYDYQNSTPWAQ